MRMLKKALALLLVVVMVFSCVGVVAAADQKGSKRTTGAGLDLTKTEMPDELKGFKSETFQKQNTYQYADDEVVRAIVVMNGAATIDVADNGSVKAVANNIRLASQHQGLKSAMKSAGVAYTVNFEYTTLLNGMSISVAYGDLEAIAAMEGVTAIHIANSYAAPVVDAETKNAFANEMTGAAALQDAGFNGKGTIIAVLDTGLNTTHEAFQDYDKTADTLTEEKVAEIVTNADGKYLSAKVPFAYDYAEGDDDVTDYNGHGTHVAGSATGYAEAEDGAVTFAGAAPGAQLLFGKIFYDDQPGTTSDIYFAAIEDAYLLGADVISMSIGAQNGFTYDSELEDVVFGNIYAKMAEEGVIMSIAAGNEGSMGDNAYNWYTAVTGEGSVMTEYTDYGVVGSPSTYEGNTSIAAVENVKYPELSLTIAGKDYSYTDSSDTGDLCKELAGKELEYVMVPNFGAEEDYKDIDVTGKVAVVSRGDITFEEKMNYAAKAGAIAVIVYNNQPGVIAMAIDNFTIPAVSVLQSTGEALAENAANAGDVPCLAVNFTDVDLSRWYHEPVDFVVDAGLVRGITDTTFCPDMNLTRGQLVTILYRNEGEPDVAGKTHPFTDVAGGRFYSKPITWAYNNGIVNGITATTFKPEDPVTREQVVAILYRHAGKPAVEEDMLADYLDLASASKYAKPALNWAVANGLISSTSTSKLLLSPKDSATRAQFAKMVMMYLGGSYKCGTHKATLSFNEDRTVFENENAWLICSFSAWGTTSDLRFKPTMTSVGGNVFSAGITGDDSYALMSGTSMATPNASGNFAQLIQYVAETYPEMSRVERAEFVKALAESSADILADNDYNVYSPRRQGAGLLNVANAVTAPAYVKNPLIEMGDDPEKTGVYTMSFDVANLTDEEVAYEVDPWPMVDAAADYSDEEYSDFANFTKYNLLYSLFAGYDYTTNCEDDILVLGAGETKTVEVTVTLDEETVAYLDEMFKNGGFVDGYTILWEQEKDENGEYEMTGRYIHASFLGFYGDWTEAPILAKHDFEDVVAAYDFIYNFDAGEIDPKLEGMNLADLGYTINDILEMDIGYNEAYLVGVSFGEPMIYDLVGGSQLFYNEQRSEYNAISNGGGDCYYDADIVYTFPTQLRNARHMIMTVTNSETGELYFVDDTDYLPKAVWDEDYAAYMQLGSFYWDGTNDMGENPSYVPNNTKVTFNYYADLDYEEDVLGGITYDKLLTDGEEYLEWSFDVMVDNEQPVISGAFYNEEDKELTLKVTDNYYMATISIYDEEFNMLDAVLCDAEPGETGTYVLDMSAYESGNIYVKASDYATNYFFASITMDGSDPVPVEDDMYEWIYETTDDMSGEYVIGGDAPGEYGMDLYMLDASGEVTGADLGKVAGAVNWWDTDVDFDINDEGMYVYGVTDDLVWVVEKTEDDNYTVRMKGSDNYLAYPGSGNALTTTTDPSDDLARWTFETEVTYDEQDDEYYAYTNLFNVGAPDRALLFNVASTLFRCYVKTYNNDTWDTYNIGLYRKVEDTTDPTDPTDPTEQPTDPTDPTEQPTDPTDPPVDPTDPTDPTNPTDPAGYTEITDPADLKVGGSYVIVATFDGKDYYLEDVAPAANTLNAAEVTDLAEATVWTLGEGSAAGNYTLSTANGGITYSSGTAVFLSETPSDLAFAYNAEAAGMTLKVVSTTNRYLMFRSTQGTTVFKAYAENNLASTTEYSGYLTVYEVG